MSSLKRIIIGEPMPDKNDPKHKERYEREVAAGKKFADASGISWVARKMQEIGQSHKMAFLAVVFGFVLICFSANIVRLLQAYQHGGSRKAVAVERLDSVLQHRHQSDAKDFMLYEED